MNVLWANFELILIHKRFLLIFYRFLRSIIIYSYITYTKLMISSNNRIKIKYWLFWSLSGTACRIRQQLGSESNKWASPHRVTFTRASGFIGFREFDVYQDWSHTWHDEACVATIITGGCVSLRTGPRLGLRSPGGCHTQLTIPTMIHLSHRVTIVTYLIVTNR